jgi:hypothetical protein
LALEVSPCPIGPKLCLTVFVRVMFSFKRRCVTRYAAYCAWSAKFNEAKSVSFRWPPDFSSSWYTSSWACCTFLLSRFNLAHHSVPVLSHTQTILSHLQDWPYVHMGSAYVCTRYLYIYVCVRMEPLSFGKAPHGTSFANSLHNI